VKKGISMKGELVVSLWTLYVWNDDTIQVQVVLWKFLVVVNRRGNSM